MNEPLPDSGWSRNWTIHANAIAAPPAETRFRQECGVWTATGDDPCAAVWRENKRLTLPLTEEPKAEETLSGRHMWGGLFFGHFGHFIAETISRLWAAPDCGAESVLFAPKHQLLTQFAGYQADIYRLLGVEIPARILQAPVRVAELVVPGQGFGLGSISRGTPEFHRMLGRLRDRISANGPEKIYVSRTQFNGRGGILDEAALERNFERLGYAIVHPQRMPIAEQFAMFKAAKVVIGLDSSAFHVLGLVAQPHQKVGIILRRNAMAFRAIEEQLTSVLGRPPVVINALVADWMPEGQKFANHQSWGELDYRELAEALVRHGFISAARDWDLGHDAASAEAVANAARATREPLVRRPISNRVLSHQLETV